MGDNGKQPPAYIYEVSIHDVLLGRGTGPNDHPGTFCEVLSLEDRIRKTPKLTLSLPLYHRKQELPKSRKAEKRRVYSNNKTE